MESSLAEKRNSCNGLSEYLRNFNNFTSKKFRDDAVRCRQSGWVPQLEFLVSCQVEKETRATLLCIFSVSGAIILWDHTRPE
jgi:hypothetical protein